MDGQYCVTHNICIWQMGNQRTCPCCQPLVFYPFPRSLWQEQRRAIRKLALSSSHLLKILLIGAWRWWSQSLTGDISAYHRPAELLFEDKKAKKSND